MSFHNGKDPMGNCVALQAQGLDLRTIMRGWGALVRLCQLVLFIGIPVAGFAEMTRVILPYERISNAATASAGTDSSTALALRTAELALQEASTAYKRKDERNVRKGGEEARKALLPLIKNPDQADIGVWRAAGVSAVLLQDAPLAAATLEAIQRLRPDFAEDRELLELLAWLNRLPVQPYLIALTDDRIGYLQALGPGPMPDLPHQNSLGMRFVPVGRPGILFSVWETRVADFRAYASLNTGVGKAWENPIFGGVPVTPGPDHPVVNVSWLDAKGFCEWLTHKEQVEGRLGIHQHYRLPTDREWSSVVGLDCEEGDTPEARDSGIKNIYPWGEQWPPPAGVGNYADLTAKTSFPSWEVIESYRDGFTTTAPVGSFPANWLGLHDLGGNVWEWCEDRYYPGTEFRVVRGGSWFNSAPQDLLSSARAYHLPSYRYDCYGFRVVLVIGAEP